MRQVTKLFKALSDHNRLRIIKMLQIRPLCVCEITEILHLAPSTVSKHLAILRDTELIIDHKDGKWVNYMLNPSRDKGYVQELLALLKNWLPDDQTIMEDACKVQTIDRYQICNANQ
jgi:ArsR family transcriptional regulator